MIITLIIPCISKYRYLEGITKMRFSQEYSAKKYKKDYITKLKQLLDHLDILKDVVLRGAALQEKGLCRYCNSVT
jgi:hypothetical protein